MTDPAVIDLLSDVDAYLCALHVHVARHDQIGADLTCGGCVLRDRIAAALPQLAAVPPADQTTDRAAILAEAADAVFALDYDVMVGEEGDENLGSMREAWDLGTIHAEKLLRRLAAEAPATTKPDTETLAAALDGLHTLIATSSRDWGTYRVDAWLWAVLCGWDCEQDKHDDTCTHGALEETAAMHGWDADTVAKARRYRAAVRALTEPAAGARQDGAQR